ncbi:MAG: ribonuclease H [Deltaproteobacteria bacterium CG_4_10_14_0_2_um_filter_43_8]|nr:MAG: ribonuclease H [Deltaproteobacteria bacterium CG11_big_fil_rev_8_21_14_0_20_42_23]PJA20129.1 MAG: ribonuclease H [Deltaproteobacteria bacterium CG_4_10_14_0_2_um_filter_43_8]PJC64416.1 MAG: ribonuclease H [Deltaproteobacteria bacterium CG_4_9_14_0_2_um_filter_42_21]
MELTIYTDGAARGNPGPAAAGAILFDAEGETLGTVSEYLGETTNNQAEYRALVLALEKAKSLGGKKLKIFADSELMVKQVNGVYRVKHDDLKPLFQKVLQLLDSFETFSLEHVRREKNKDADRLANLALDSHM